MYSQVQSIYAQKFYGKVLKLLANGVTSTQVSSQIQVKHMLRSVACTKMFFFFWPASEDMLWYIFEDVLCIFPLLRLAIWKLKKKQVRGPLRKGHRSLSSHKTHTCMHT